ncbi:MAG: NYN domain-containing protein [Pirellulaceae bacterium]|nr:NYN domain-containing protein [Pirellulaceae bacterium]
MNGFYPAGCKCSHLTCWSTWCSIPERLPGFIRRFGQPIRLAFFYVFTGKQIVRTSVYIDGFNLYYGAIRGTSHKWLNLESYFSRLLPNDEIVAINYFTAPVHGQSGIRQASYLLALATLPLVTIVLGKFKDKMATCRVAPCSFNGDRRFKVAEEKRTDVNIAVQLLDDAYQNVSEKIVLVSGDSDLVPALQMIRLRFTQKKIAVYVPAIDPVRGAAVELRSVAHANRTLPNNLLAHSQFPSSISDGSGGLITKPAGW